MRENMDMLDRMERALARGARSRLGDETRFPSPSTGGRAFGDFRIEPGLSGSFNFIHALGLEDPCPLRFIGGCPPRRISSEGRWLPSHLEFVHRYAGLTIREAKYISRDDLVVSELEFLASGRIELEALLESGFQGGGRSTLRQAAFGRVRATILSSVAGEGEKLRLTLRAGEPFRLRVACALGLESDPIPDRIPSLEEHRAEFARSLEGLPALECSDSDLERVYYYRCWLLRSLTVEPRVGRLQGKTIFEGHSSYPNWEFSRSISCSSSLHLFDARWTDNFELRRGIIETYVRNEGAMLPFLGYEYEERGLLPGCVRAGDAEGHYFYHLLPYHALLLYRDGGCDRDWIRSVLPALRRDLEAWPHIAPGSADDGLPTMLYEGDNAMEFGPASHAYREGEDFDAEGARLNIGTMPELGERGLRWGPPRPNKRTEVAAFYALNLEGLSGLCEALGDSGAAADYTAKASRTRAAILGSMWSPEDGFFLELDAAGRKLRGIKQVGGLFALLAVDPPDLETYLSVLASPQSFRLPAGLPSASADSFGFAPDNTLGGLRPHSCLWNGPVWPYAASYGLLGLGELYHRTRNDAQRRGIGSIFADQFAKYLSLHFLAGDRGDIRLVEHYDAMTGMPLSDQEDYNHSCFIDLVVRMICGFAPEGPGKINFDPLPCGPESLRLCGLRYAGEEYTIILAKDRAVLERGGKVVREIQRGQA